MPAQLPLDGFDDTLKPTDRLFLAIFPDVNAATRIAQHGQRLRSKHGLTGRPLATERLHVTLHHLGDYVGVPQNIVTAAGIAAATVAMPQFEVSYDRVMSFWSGRNIRPFVLCGTNGVGALTAFHEALGTAMKKSGLGQWVKPDFTPHVTLLYDSRCVTEEAIETVGWTAREFVLVHSLLGRSRHIPLGRWPLSG